MPDAADIEPSRGYAICCDARVGSVFLTRLLGSTGVLGRPFEFFKDDATVARVRRAPEATLAELARQASTPNGVYGLKVFGPHFDRVARARWVSRLPGLRFVLLTRDDLLGQALSLARALQTGAYGASSPLAAAPRYDAHLIGDCLARLAYGRARWESWFARNGIAPLRLTCERVAAEPVSAVESIKELVQLEGPARIEAAALEWAVQRDTMTDEWRARFVAEQGDTDYLDAGRLLGRTGRPAAFARLFLGARR